VAIVTASMKNEAILNRLMGDIVENGKAG